MSDLNQLLSVKDLKDRTKVSEIKVHSDLLCEIEGSFLMYQIYLIPLGMEEQRLYLVILSRLLLTMAETNHPSEDSLLSCFCSSFYFNTIHR